MLYIGYYEDINLYPPDAKYYCLAINQPKEYNYTTIPSLIPDEDLLNSLNKGRIEENEFIQRYYRKISNLNTISIVRDILCESKESDVILLNTGSNKDKFNYIRLIPLFLSFHHILCYEYGSHPKSNRELIREYGMTDEELRLRGICINCD